MTSAQYPTYGNLALKPVALDAPRLTVVNGGAAPRTGNAPQRRTLPLVAGLAAIVVMATLLLFAALSMSLESQTAMDSALSSTARETIVVTPGESLWSIAENHPIEGMDTDETVYVIRSWNDLDSSLLQPGMSLSVPER